MPVNVGPVEAALLTLGPLLCLAAIFVIVAVILIVVVRNGNRQKTMQAQADRLRSSQDPPSSQH